MTETGIRPARAADLDAARRIVAAAYAPHAARMGKRPGPMDDDYAARIAEGAVHVIEGDDGGVIGLVVLLPQDDAMLLDNVAVAPEAQGLGIGRRLVAFAEAEARRQGFGVLWLYTHESMVENMAFYRSAGFAETHRVTERGFERVYFGKGL